MSALTTRCIKPEDSSCALAGVHTCRKFWLKSEVCIGVALDPSFGSHGSSFSQPNEFLFSAAYCRFSEVWVARLFRGQTPCRFTASCAKH